MQSTFRLFVDFALNRANCLRFEVVHLHEDALVLGVVFKDDVKDKISVSWKLDVRWNLMSN